MTDTLAIALVTGISAIFSAYFAYRAKTASQDTHTAVNSRLTQLLEVTKLLAISEGVEKEKVESQKKHDAIRALLLADAKAILGHAEKVAPKEDKDASS